MKDTWHSRELPVLESIAEYFEEEPTGTLTPQAISARAGRSLDEVTRALIKLDAARPPFLTGRGVEELAYPVLITGITERTLRSVGQWSSPESLVEQFIDALNRASEEEKRPEHKDMLRRAAETIRGAAYQIAIAWVSGALPHP